MLPRSGLAARHGIALVNAPGLIDAGYRGEVRVLLLNTDRERAVRDRGGRPDRAARGRRVPARRVAERSRWPRPRAATAASARAAADGAEFLIVPQSAFEWLDEHAGLHEHLRTNHVLVTHQKHVCDVYELCPPEPREQVEVAQQAPAAEHPPARRSLFETLFGWTRRSSANGRPV